MSTYRWINHEGTKLYDIGILADGALHNPNNYPEDAVRAAVAEANARRHERRSLAARKAAETRKLRQERKVYRIAQRITEGHDIGPGNHCALCGKGLSDSESIRRGIGSECWQGVLKICA